MDRLIPRRLAVTTRHRRAGAFVALALALTSSAPSRAGSLPDRGSADDQTACTPDVMRLCAGDIPDEASILACLRRKSAELGSDCRRVVAPASPRQATAK